MAEVDASARIEPGPVDAPRLLRVGLSMSLTVALSLIAGMTDAIGFRHTGEFVSFMSGNTTRMSIAFSGGDFARAERLLTVIGLFVLGNALGAVVARAGGRRHATSILFFVSAVLAVAAGLPRLPGMADRLGLETLPGFEAGVPLDMTVPSLVLMIFAMGALNSAVESVEGVGLGLTYVTGALSKFGRGLGKFLLGDRSLGWTFHLGPFCGLVLGALLGNALDARTGRQALWLPCGVATLLALCFLWIPEDWQQQLL